MNEYRVIIVAAMRSPRDNYITRTRNYLMKTHLAN